MGEDTIPYRFPDIIALCAQVMASDPGAFPPGAPNDAWRRNFLINTIVPTLNANHPEDAGGWGYLTKTDQKNADGSYVVPPDIIVWKPTMETVDVLTGWGASWIVHDPPPPAWLWTSASGSSPVPADPGGGVGSSAGAGAAHPYDEGQVLSFIAQAAALYEAKGRKADPAAGIWIARMQFDAVTIGYDAAIAKHLAGLAQALAS